MCAPLQEEDSFIYGIKQRLSSQSKNLWAKWRKAAWEAGALLLRVKIMTHCIREICCSFCQITIYSLQTGDALTPDTIRVQIRLVIPRRLSLQGTPLYQQAAQFFAKQGERVYVQKRLLQLSGTLPIVIEGVVSESSFEAFLVDFPLVDKIVVLAERMVVHQAIAVAS